MDNDKGSLRRHANIASIGINLVVATFVGLGIGLYLDKYFGTAPWLMLIFLVFGIAAGFKNMFEQVKKYGMLDDEDDTKDG
jgi:ATP synthase protein I